MTGANVANIAVVIGLLALAAVIFRVCRRLPATRVSVMPADLTPPDEPQLTPDDAAFIADLSARMKQYGTAVADRYDTPEGHQ